MPTNWHKSRVGIRMKVKFIIAGLILAFCVAVVYFLPKAKYKGKNITADILNSIPMNCQSWQGEDIEGVPRELKGEVYNFVSRIFARQYINSVNPGQSVFLVILDAGNFHYPKVCFKGVGFSSEELPQRELSLPAGKLRVHLMLSKKKDEQVLSIYWICIDKRIVPTWAQQKLKQLYYSLFNKERVGLMVRVDVPVRGNIDNSVEIVKNFLNGLYQVIPRQYRDYIFGTFVSL